MKQVQRQYNHTDGQQGFDGHSLGNSTKQDDKTARRTERRTTRRDLLGATAQESQLTNGRRGNRRKTETGLKECILRIATKTKRLAEEPNLNTKGERTCLYLHEWLFANYGVHALPVRAPLTKHLPFQGTQAEQGR